MEGGYPACARCGIKKDDQLCRTKDGRSIPGCPTAGQTDLLAAAMEEYRRPAVAAFARAAAVQEGEGYGEKEGGYGRLRPIKCRLEETAEFAGKMGYRRLGLAFCTGLAKEAAAVERFFRGRDFEVVSVVCKAGRVPKETLGVSDHEKVAPGTDEQICNPIFQAMLLNAAETEFNIMLGLCVGHDSLFMKYSEAPCTVLAAKDRLLGHNPLAAVYTIESYSRYLK
ncbi:DUF1847 domain-containing protein [Methanofollis formosanus]|uniref:DUF1847 domain-containing protein n=1 Tax=Methanofollis formosanus TaxID=299308 RepID=A0A8G0ZZZ2_9EURY|nr:DUF1847 domain-containing protein [Methanofollis formosanus]QYZ77958.1 DUF1847 domain-containing protein [Methanofollis formosanus]